MGKPKNKLTRRAKACLTLLTDEPQTALSIGATEENLNALVAHGLASAATEAGTTTYRITDLGQDYVIPPTRRAS